MSVKNLATLDRDICQPLGRILQEAFADGYIGTGSIRVSKAVTADPADGLSNGQFQYVTTLNCAMVNACVVGAEFKLNIANAGVIGMPGYTNPVLRLTIDENGDDTPNLDGGELSALSCQYYIDEVGGAPRDATVLHVVAGAYNFDYLLMIQNAGDCGDSDHPGGANKVVGFDGDADIVKIPVKIAGRGTHYYILVGQEMAEVDSD